MTLRQKVLRLTEENKTLENTVKVYRALLITQTTVIPQPLYRTQKERCEVFIEGMNYFATGELKK